jgi:hypothetical protein
MIQATNTDGSVYVTKKTPKLFGNYYLLHIKLTRKEILALAKSSLKGCTLEEVFK